MRNDNRRSSAGQSRVERKIAIKKKKRKKSSLLNDGAQEEWEEEEWEEEDLEGENYEERKKRTSKPNADSIMSIANVYAPKASTAKIHMALEGTQDPEPSKPTASVRRMRDEEAQAMYRRALEREKQSKVAKSAEDTQKEVEAMIGSFQAVLAKDKYLIMPDGKFMHRWDILFMAALLFTAIAKPYEVAFLDVVVGDGLYICNWIIDAFFLFDMILQFFIPIRNVVKLQGVSWIKDPKMIAVHYLRSWFLVDLVSIIPFESIFTGTRGSNVFDLLQLLRLLRLLKLLRVLKASKVWQKWEAQLAVPYGYIALLKFSVLLLMMGHWMACAWAITVDVQLKKPRLPGYDAWAASGGDPYTWLDEVADKGWEAYRDPTPIDKYSVSLYWAITTITSVGYGDVSPQNPAELQVCTVFILLGSILWAYIIGNACGIAASLDVENIRHHQTMDDLNYFMMDQHLEPSQRYQLRSFFNQSKEMAREENYKSLIGRMSPTLRAVVSRRRAEWLYRVSYFSTASEKFLIALVMELNSDIFIPGEVIPWSNSLTAVSRGIASRKGRVCLAGSFWGEDFILVTSSLKDTAEARALTYAEIVTLDREVLFEIAESFPVEQEILRRRISQMAAARGVLKAAKIIKTLQDDPQADIAAESEGVLAKSFNNNGGWAAVRAETAAQDKLAMLAAKASSGDLGIANLEEGEPGETSPKSRVVTISSPESTMRTRSATDDSGGASMRSRGASHSGDSIIGQMNLLTRPPTVSSGLDERGSAKERRKQRNIETAQRPQQIGVVKLAMVKKGIDSFEKSIFNEIFTMGEAIDANQEDIAALKSTFEDAMGTIDTLAAKLDMLLNKFDGGTSPGGKPGRGSMSPAESASPSV